MKARKRRVTSPPAPDARGKSTAPPSPTGPDQPPRKPRRTWLFRGIALLLPLLLFGTVELGLRLADYGFSTDFFLRRTMNGKVVLTDNEKFGRWFFPPSQARASAPFSIPAQKPAGTYRIFVLGESAAMGDPDPAFSFARMLEVLLRDRYPGAQFEFINTGITAIDSHVILPIARDCARLEGDLWLIYMGNNEVVGPYGAGTIFGPEAPPLPVIRASLAAKGTRIGQGLSSLLAGFSDSKSSAAWGGMKMFLDHQVAADDPRMQRVYAHFEHNLADILKTGERAGVKQIVCTVGSNLKDCPPFASLHGVAFAARKSDWETAYTNGIALEAAGRFDEASERYAQAEQIDPNFAEVQFRRGHCFSKLGRHDEARRCFERARDLDTLRFRADSRLNQIIAAQSRNRAKDDIYFLDAAELLTTNSPHSIPGEEMFYEHVHLTSQANYLVARAAAEQIAKLLPENVARRMTTNDWLSDAACMQRLGWNDWSRFKVTEEVRMRMLEPPFTGQLDHPGRIARIEQTLRSLASAGQPDRLRQTALEFNRSLAGWPEDPILHDRMAQVLCQIGDFPGAAGQWQSVINLLPHRSATYESLGALYLQTGRSADARKCLETALDLNPESISALNGLGMTCISQDQFQEAVGYFQRALRMKPPYQAGLHMNLGHTFERQGKNAEAKAEYQEVLRTEPENGMALICLGLLLNREEKFAEALVPLTKAVQLRPQIVNARLGLATALEHQGKTAEAIVHYQEALRLEPANAIAKSRLEALTAQGSH